MLTRYASYLIAQNYFALQTRNQELIEDRMKLIARMEARGRLKEAEKQLSKNIYERGVVDAGFGRIRSKGNSALFGGKNTSMMKGQYGIKDNRPLADFLPTLTMAAKNLATEMTNHNVTEEDMLDGNMITSERSMLGKRGI